MTLKPADHEHEPNVDRRTPDHAARRSHRRRTSLVAAVVVLTAAALVTALVIS